MFLCKHQNELKSLNIGINLNKIIALYDLIKTKTQRVFRKKKRLFDKLFTLGIKLHKIIMLKRDVERWNAKSLVTIYKCIETSHSLRDF